MISKFRQRFSRLFKIYRQFSTLQKKETGTVAKREFLQFSKTRLTEFGDLPQGQVPEALQFDLPFNQSKLANGVTVCTEAWNNPLASITVLIKAGTRQETLETSGTCQFLEKLNFRGTGSRSKEDIQRELSSFGGQISVRTERECTRYTLTFQKDQVDQAVGFLADILQNSLYNKNQIEAERDLVYTKCVENHKDQKTTTTEAAHYTSFRDHFISQPVLGIRENIANITEDHIKDFHATHFTGKNLFIVGAGSVNHESFVGACEKHFGKVPSEAPAGSIVANSEQPFFTPSMLYMRDDEMANVNIGVFFNAPKFTDPDFIGMWVFQKIIGEYRADKFTGAYLNSADRQYNQIHAEIGQMPDITLQRCEYFPYSDCGLFGNYFHGNEVFANQMLFMSQMILSEYASHINEVEVFRAKNRLYNELLESENSCKLSQHISKQVAFLGRRIPRSEIARRVSHFDSGILNRVATRWFWDKEISVVAWGPIHHLMTYSHYNRPIRRSTVGWYGSQHYRII